MANVAQLFRNANPDAPVVGRGRNYIVQELASGRKVASIAMRPIHIANTETEINSDWQATSGAWQYQMVTSDYHAFSRNQLGVGTMYRYQHPATGEYVELQPLALNWVNDADSRQQITQPQSVMAQVVNGDTLHFPNGYGTGRHFSYTATESKLVKLLKIDSAASLPAPTVTGTPHLEIEFITTKSAGVTEYVDGVQWDRSTRVGTPGRIEYRTSQGVVLWAFDYPIAWDSAGNSTTGLMVLRRQGANRFVTVRVAKSWLDGATYPVYLDPTLTLQPDGTAGIDNYIISTATTSNQGTAVGIQVGERNSASGQISRGMIKFDLSSLPADATIDSATLSLYAITDLSSNARVFRIYRYKRAWVETQATWEMWATGNNWSSLGGFHVDDCEQTDIGSRNMSASETLNEFKDFVLTPTTKADLDLGNGWLIKADTETDDFYQFASSDDTTAANRPRLVIEYTEAGGGGGVARHAMYYQRMRAA